MDPTQLIPEQTTSGGVGAPTDWSSCSLSIHTPRALQGEGALELRGRNRMPSTQRDLRVRRASRGGLTSGCCRDNHAHASSIKQKLKVEVEFEVECPKF